MFTTRDSRRTDAGGYKVVAQNRHGKDAAKLRVNVLDVPGKPTGPIMFTDIAADAWWGLKRWINCPKNSFQHAALESAQGRRRLTSDQLCGGAESGAWW